ncbi:MAG: DUF433 domain-containing protein [Egibacteraceae bacterium]
MGSPEAPDRFTVPLYTLSEAARCLGVPRSTFTSWARGYERRSAGRPAVKGAPIVTALPVPSSGTTPVVPFVGLAEGMVLAAIRRHGVPLQRIRPALQVIKERLGIAHALASRSLYTDGAEVLYDYAEAHGETPEAASARQLVVVRHGQRVFTEVVQQYLHRIEYAADGYARLIRLPQYERAQVVADPSRSFGQPIFERGGARLSDVLQRFWAGEDLDVVAEDFGVPQAQLEDVLRVASRRAA